jgi:hypothetical protein
MNIHAQSAGGALTDYIEIFRRADLTAKNELPRGQE